jgi:putative exosortase-associated protein (TIGR04073 family)
MRKLWTLAAGGLLAAFAVGCAGPEKKLGRGLANVTEFARLGEMRRSVEQTAMFDSPTTAYTAGVIKGFNRSLVRTFVGVYEIVTCPIPSYDPVLHPGGPILPDATVGPAYPDSYTPNLISDTTFEPDTHTGFSGGDIMPFVPGSRFHIYDY